MNYNQKIEVTVKFFATLRKYGPAKTIDKYPKESRVEKIIEKYKIPKKEQNFIILINGIPHKQPESKLHDGDVVSIFPPIGGG
jgi:molybdopterin converting factor small subunit